MKRVFIGYLIITSVIFHFLVLGGGLWFMSTMKDAFEMSRNSIDGSGEPAVVRDISTITDGEYSYQGYSLDYKGKPLYVEGRSNENIHVGDEIIVNISKHPYGPIKSLMVMVDNRRPNKTRDVDAKK